MRLGLHIARLMMLTAFCLSQVRARIQSGAGAEALPDDTLQRAEHLDLIHFGLIPEFVGRFPIMCSLQARTAGDLAHSWQA